MDDGNKTALENCRFLNDEYFSQLYETFIAAFSDYVVPFALTELQFRNHINLNGVDLSRTVGCFDGGRMVGFSLNGFGIWNGRQTVYDAGTGVLPAYRRQGISDAMFEMMMPVFRDGGAEQFLLEVVTTNHGAVELYKKLGFTAVRELALLQCDGMNTSGAPSREKIEIRDLSDPDWDLLVSFSDGDPSWQNSVDAIRRTNKLKRIVGAFINGNCVGYVAFSAKFGRIAQCGVSKKHRGIGVGTALIGAMHAETADGFSMQVINIDTSLTLAMDFFQKLGFYERLRQYEMVREM
ncbi:GNAT family N-acetyltransferase [soil metagenome]